MPLKIIYLDDEPDLAELFADEFSSSEIEVSTFTEPEKAIAAVWSHPPDIIFLDYRLPGTTGDKVASAMPANIPKYLVTGDIAVKTDYPFLGVIPKPIKPEDISAILNALCKKT